MHRKPHFRHATGGKIPGETVQRVPARTFLRHPLARAYAGGQVECQNRCFGIPVGGAIFQSGDDRQFKLALFPVLHRCG